MNQFFSTLPTGRRALHGLSLAFGYMALTGILLAFAMDTLGLRIGAVSTLGVVAVVAGCDSHTLPLRKAAVRLVRSASSVTWVRRALIGMAGLGFIAAAGWAGSTAPLSKSTTVMVAAGFFALVAAVACKIAEQFVYGLASGLALAVVAFPIVTAYGAHWAPNVAGAGLVIGMIYAGLVAATAAGLTLARYLPS